MKIEGEKGPAEAIPLYKRAIELDPSFAVAYGALAGAYSDLGGGQLADQYATRAFELRDHVSEREKFIISSGYYGGVIGDLDKANQVLELYARTYPRAFLPHLFLANNYSLMGQHEKSLAETLEDLRLDPNPDTDYSNLILTYMFLNRLADARATALKAPTRIQESPAFHANLYVLAFLEGDAAEMERQLAWSASKPIEDPFLSSHSDTEAYYGHVRKARELSRHAVETARRSDKKEAAALWMMDDALREAEFGNTSRAREESAAALTLANPGTSECWSRWPWHELAIRREHEELTDELAKEFPMHTLINGYWLPTIRAAIEINRNNPAGAIESLRAASILRTQRPQSGRGSCCAQSMCEARLTCKDVREAKPLWSSRSLLITAAWFRILRWAPLHVSASPAPTACRAIPPKPSRHIRISSRCGKTLTRTFPSS